MVSNHAANRNDNLPQNTELKITLDLVYEKEKKKRIMDNISHDNETTCA